MSYSARAYVRIVMCCLLNKAVLEFVYKNSHGLRLQKGEFQVALIYARR